MSEPLDTPAVLDRLNAALPLQQRSALRYTLAAGSVTGLELAPLAERLFAFSVDELADVRRVVEKITALGGRASTDVAALDLGGGELTQQLRELCRQEAEAVEALQAVIPETGTDGASEALEHLMEHVILRKQDQLDFLIRALSGPG